MEKNLFFQSSLFGLWMKKTFLPHYSPCRWQKCVCWWTFQAETLSLWEESSTTLAELYLYGSFQHCNFTHHCSWPETPATNTLLAHSLWSLSSLAGRGHETSKVTGECYITKWGVHTGQELCLLLLLKPQAPKSSGTIPALLYKTIWIWQHRFYLVFNDMSRELAKIQDRVEPSSGNTETLGCKCIIPSTDYHFVPGSTLRPTHTERVLKSTTSSV